MLEVAKLRTVLLFILSTAPVAELLIPTNEPVAPVVDVMVAPPAPRLVPLWIKPVRILPVVELPIVLLLILNVPAPATSIPVIPPFKVALVPEASIDPIVLF